VTATCGPCGPAAAAGGDPSGSLDRDRSVGMFTGRKRVLLGALYVLLTLAVMDGALWIFHDRVRTYFDEELGRRLTAIASTVALSLDPGVVQRLREGQARDEERETIRSFLDDVSAENELAGLYLLDTEERDLLRGDPRGSDARVINLDPVAVAKAEVGLTAFSETYELDDLYFKSGYAPVLGESGEVVAVVAAEADAAYFTFLSLIRRSLLVVSLLGLAGAAVLGVVLAGLTRSISKAEEAVARANLLATLGRMAAAVAHDIRNPLGIIGGAAQRLRTMGGTRSRSEEEAELLEFITEEVERLDKIVEGYLDMARPAQGAAASEVAPLLERAAGMCERDFESAGVRCDVDATGLRGARVRGDSAQLQQAFLNVMSNAREAMPEGGELTIVARRSGSEVVIEFRDSGGGIGRGDLRRVREPFFSTKQSGSGLGLAIVDKVVADAGGRLEIESERGRGTTVRMTLPVAEEE